MVGLGTIVNVVAVIVAGILGLGLSHGLSKSMQEGVTRSLGLAVVFMGASTSIGLMQELPDSSIMIVLSLSMGAALGEWIGIE